MKVAADWLLSPGALQVCGVLTDAGHQAWFVGGCVRNAIIGADATDVDIATDATPDRVMALAEAAGLRVVPTGFDHGTVTVLAGDDHFEVTTFRHDVETHGRRATVAFGADMAEDAARRDLTINALYAAPDGVVADPLGTGLPDLLARRVRFIGNPHDRIREDFLRILRFFRFHAWYGDPAGGLDADGLAACAAHVDGLDGLSRERIGAEMKKLLAAPDPAPAVAAMAMSGVLLRILPGAGAQTLTVLVHVEQVAGLPPDPIRRLAALGGVDAEDGLRLSGAEAKRLVRLKDAMQSDAGAGELGYRLGAAAAQDALALRAAMAGQEIDPVAAQEALDGATRVFPLRAADLMPALSGPALGAALKDLEARWIAADFAPGRDDLIALALNGG